MNELLEDKFIKLAEERIAAKKYKVFDKNSRLVKRQKFPDLIKSGRTMSETSLVILNAEGETIVLTEEFERELFRILKFRYEM